MISFHPLRLLNLKLHSIPIDIGTSPRAEGLFLIFQLYGIKKGVFCNLLYFMILVFVLSSCETKVETIKNSDILSLPSVTNKDIETIYDDSGKVQLILRAPLIEMFSNDDSPYTEFTRGIYVLFYDGKKDSVGFATAKYAKFTDKKKLWELRDSVIVVNVSSDRLETEQLFWDQDKDLIYTDRFVKIINEDQTIQGTGFESDIRLTTRKIKNPSGPIYLKNE
ncbi:MAG: LPS export ABC transporter periplasmic protein LptC [Bacteroidia bacterium]|nr:LPS export ABC transporter periplasmic protein LptC [Bacteroidia bacterium]